MNRDDIIKQNIAFMYGRNQAEMANDPDKRAYVRTSHRYVERDIINSFTNEFDYLAPDYPCPVYLSGDDDPYPSYEHALQASKTANRSLRVRLREISDIKELKRTVVKQGDIRPDWKETSPAVAEQLLRDKFFRHKDLQKKLMSTEHRTIQFVNNFGDQFWGVTQDKQGRNKLGKAIESVRLWFEKGLIQDMWLRDHFSLEDGDKVCIDVRAYRDDEEVVEDRQTIMRKAVIEIGKHEDNDVVTGHPTTSRRHSLLLIDKNKGPLLIDLHSANGTYMDGAQIKGACPTSLSSGVSGVCFGASRKRYIFTIDLNADNRRKEQLYMKLSDPDVAKEDAAETTVFLGNLPYTCTEEDIINTFGSCGAIRQLTIPKDKTSGEGRGIAFITFETSSAMRQALTRDGDDVGGRAVKVKRSEAKGSSKPSEKPPSKGSKGSESGGGRSYYEGPKEETRHGGRPDRQERTRSISHSPDRRRQRRSRSGSRSRSSGRRHSRTRRNNRSRSRSGSVDEFGRRDKRSKPSRDRKRQRSRSSSSTYSR